ncbi:hypothetical protein MTsPCn3_30340 [Erythrobacter sp. MTPC3]
MPRPQEQAEGLRDRARHQPRSASRGVAGCPRRRGSRRQRSGSGSGEDLPPLQRKDRPMPTLRNRTPAIHWSSTCCPQLRDLARRSSNLLATPARCAPPIARLVSSLPMDYHLHGQPIAFWRTVSIRVCDCRHWSSPSFGHDVTDGDGTRCDQLDKTAVRKQERRRPVASRTSPGGGEHRRR